MPGFVTAQPLRFARSLLAAICLMAPLCRPSVARSQLPSAASIRSEIRLRGAKEVVARLYNTRVGGNGESDWSRVTYEIWHGNPDYIALAPLLAPGTDAWPSEDLGVSLAHALPLAPMTVVRVIDPHDGAPLGASRICGAPFLQSTIDDIPGYLRHARAAVAKITAPELTDVKFRCLEQLDKAASR